MVRLFNTVTLVAALALSLVSVTTASITRRQTLSTNLDCTKPATHKSTYTGEKGTFEVLCGWDYGGGDYKGINVPTFDACVKACDAEEACIAVAYVYDQQNCYLKDVQTPATALAWVNSARKTSKASGVTCAGGASNGATYASANGNFEIVCGVDYAGADIAALQVASFEDCIKACDNDARCVDVSYSHMGKTCWTKDRLTTPNPVEAIWTAKKVVKEKPTSQVTCVGNAADGTTYKATKSSFQILCGVDYGGGDIAAAQYDTFEECMKACDVDDRCVDVSYDPQGRNCWMKDTLNTLNPVGWVWTGKKIQDPTTKSTVANAVSCSTAGTNGKTFKTTTGNEYQIICGQDYAGGDLKAVDAPTFQACIETCDSTPGCIDVAYVGPACYMKDKLNTLVQSAWVSTALLVKRPKALTCQAEESHDTVFTTKDGRQYDIQCGYDYPGGDMKMVYADTFQLCLEACDDNIGCIDVAYSGVACYMKDTLNPKQVAGWVSNARYIGMASVSSTSLIASSTTATSSSGTATVTPISQTACASGSSGSFIPSSDPDVDRSATERLTPVTSVSLNYAESPGNRVMQVELLMNSATLVLENSARIASVTCKNSTTAQPSEMTLFFSNENDASSVYTTLAQSSGLVLITNTVGCNINTARGFWQLDSAGNTPPTSSSFTIFVKERKMIDVASQITLVYGKVDDSGKQSFTSTSSNAASVPSAPIGPGSVCSASATLSSTASSSVSSTSSKPSATGYRPPPETLDDLTPAARELYDFFLANIQVENGNIKYNVPAQKGQEIPAATYNPDDLAGQQAVEDAFKEAGLDKPSDLLSKATDGLKKVAANVCPSDSATVKRKLLEPSIQARRERIAKARALRLGNFISNRLEARETDGWDIACDDTVTELVGHLPGGGALELVCAGKSLYDNRDAIKCLFGGCKTTTYITTKTTTYDFNYSWTMNFPTISQVLKYGPGSKALSCVNCGFSVTSISFTGKIIVVVTNGNLEIKQADVTPGIAGTAYMIARLQSDGPWEGTWNHNYNSLDLGPIQMDGAFRINPTVLYGVGIDFSTDSKVDVTGGARFSWSNADASINILQSRLTNQRNWQPSVEFTFPSFKQGSAVSLKPYMRWIVKIKVDIYGMVHLNPFITSQTVAGIDSSYSFTATASCPANNLLVNNFVYSANTIGFGDGNSAVLYSGQAGSAKRCLPVPGITPSADEIASLRNVGQNFCTKYINYRPPSTWTYVTETSTVPSTTTTFVTTTVTTTSTVYSAVTTSFDSYLTRTFSARTVTVTASDKTAKFAYLNFRRGLDEHTPTPTAGPDRRAVGGGVVAQATPTMVKDWDATKISFACKQIATGTETNTYTTTTTTTSGVVTATGTITKNAQGPLQTYTYTISSTRYMGIATATVAGTVATETVCPPSPVNTCFKIKVHGCPWVEDKYIRYHQWGSFQPESWYGTDYVFYLTTQGHLIGYIPGGPSLVLGTEYPYVSNDYWGEVYMKNMDQAWNGFTYAKCAKDSDPCSKGLTCSIIDAGGVERFGMSLQVPDFQSSSYFEDDMDGISSNSFRPAWYKLPDTSWYKWLPFTMTYEDAPCPC
ncbi:kelch domain-containing protein [Colletotrichum camelliae]|nr:kelch domain-containing protein [Colletotrichum camelliae]